MRKLPSNYSRGYWLAPLALLALAAGPMVDSRYVAVVKRLYKLDDGSTVKLEGACSYDDQTISCWNADGNPDPSLSEKVSAYYLMSMSNTLSFVFNRKNRLAVFTHSNPNIGVNVSTTTTGGLGVATPPGKDLFWSEVNVPEGQPTIDLVLSPNGVNAGQPTRGVFRENSTFEYAGITFKIGGSKPEPSTENDEPSPPGAFWMQHLPPGKHWLYYVSSEQPENNQVELQYELLDHAGHRIRYVDRDGKPVSDLKRVEENHTSQMAFYSPPWDIPPDPKYPRAQIYPKRVVGSVSVLVSDVDPAEVGFLNVSGTRRYSVLFKDIPLDPK